MMFFTSREIRNLWLRLKGTLRCSVACGICRHHVIHSCSITVHIFIHFFDHKCRLDNIIIDSIMYIWCTNKRSKWLNVLHKCSCALKCAPSKCTKGLYLFTAITLYVVQNYSIKVKPLFYSYSWQKKMLKIRVTMMLVTTVCWWHYDGDHFKMLVAES